VSEETAIILEFVWSHGRLRFQALPRGRSCEPAREQHQAL